MSVISRLSTSSLSSPLFRSYHIAAATAAQLQFDYDYDFVTPPPSPAATVVDTDASLPLRSFHWVFIGNPNAKKHIYAEMISKLLQVPRISVSSLLRQDLNPRSPLYNQIAEAINHRKLVPESIIFGLLSKRLEDGHYQGENGFILDGIPRTLLQAEILDELVGIDLVVNFKCCEDHFKAADSTASCDKSKSSFPNHATEDHEPKVSACHREQMQLLENYYQKQKKLIDFQVGNAPGENWKGLLAALNLQHTNAAVHSSRTLTTGFRLP